MENQNQPASKACQKWACGRFPFAAVVVWEIVQSSLRGDLF
jgi:hypothetical protein